MELSDFCLDISNALFRVSLRLLAGVVLGDQRPQILQHINQLIESRPIWHPEVKLPLCQPYTSIQVSRDRLGIHADLKTLDGLVERVLVSLQFLLYLAGFPLGKAEVDFSAQGVGSLFRFVLMPVQLVCII